jgi:hypothetical protein
MPIADFAAMVEKAPQSETQAQPPLRATHPASRRLH